MTENNNNPENKADIGQEGSNIWQEILSESITKKDNEEINIFVFGDKNSGKKSLIRIMNKEFSSEYDYKKSFTIEDDALKYGLMNYSHLTIKKNYDDDSDTVSKVGVWIMNELIDKETFLTLIKPKDIINCVCLVVVDYSRPWTIQASLQRWTDFIYEIFASLMLKFPFDVQKEIRKKIEDRIKLYDEPKFDEEGNLIKDSLSDEEKSRRLQISLNNDVLITNSGVPIIFVVNKTDNPFQKYENKSEFILRHVRKAAINYGATVVYTSTKSNFNITVLYDYIFHILLNCDLVHKSNLIDKTSFFIPSGYDRLSVLKSNDTQHDLDSEYTDVIKEEKEEEILEEEVKCDKLSDFLKKIKERVYKSRKSMIRDDIKFGKSLVPGLNSEMLKKIDENKEKEVKEENTNAEKVNKFQKFMEKKDANPEEGGEKKETLSKEERAKITKQNLLNKLRLSKVGK